MNQNQTLFAEALTRLLTQAQELENRTGGRARLGAVTLRPHYDRTTGRQQVDATADVRFRLFAVAEHRPETPEAEYTASGKRLRPRKALASPFNPPTPEAL